MFAVSIAVLSEKRKLHRNLRGKESDESCGRRVRSEMRSVGRGEAGKLPRKMEIFHRIFRGKQRWKIFFVCCILQTNDGMHIHEWAGQQGRGESS